MRRVVTISWLLLVFCLHADGQLGRIHGELRYEHRYQDYQYDGTLTRMLTRNPMLDLRMRGNFLAPRIASYSLFTSLNANYVSTNSPLFQYSTRQLSWGRYNLQLNLLPYSPVKLTIAARENSYDLRAGDDFLTNYTTTRQQEQRAELSVHQIPWLPTLSFSYVRSRAFSVRGFPYDIVSQTMTFSATGATDTTGAYALNATMSDLRDEMSGDYDKFMTLEFSASRTLSARHVLNFNADYEKYRGYRTLGSSVVHSGVLSNRLRLTTSVAGGITTSIYTQSRSLSLSETATYRISDYFFAGAGLTGFIGDAEATRAGDGRRDHHKSAGYFGNVQHRRSFGSVAMVNSVNAGYREQFYGGRYKTMTAGLSNSLSRPIGVYMLTGDYTLSVARLRNSIDYDIIDNTASVQFGGALTQRIRTQSDVRYRDSRYPGDPSIYRHQRNLLMTQRLNGSFVYVIPFSIGVSGSANWYMAAAHGRTYGWSASFASPSFFVRGLAMDYVYTRSYDPYYRREVADHHGSLTYNWRAVVFGSRFRYSTFPVRVREVLFTVSRPF